MVTDADVLKALSHVKDPELHKDLVSLGMVKDLKIDGGRVSFTVVLTTPACPLKSVIEKDCRAAVGALPGVQEIQLTWGASVASARGGAGRQAIPGVKNSIAVASGKGGVGKSTVSVNLAVALAETGASVGLLDADIYGPSIPLMMGVHEVPETDGQRIFPLENYGVRLMSLGFLLPEGSAPVIWRGPMVAKALQQFLYEVVWGELDYLLIDLPPGTGDAQLSLAQSIPLSGVVIVMTPQDLAMSIASKALQMFRQLKVPVLGIIENMSGFLCPHCGKGTEIFSAGGGRKAAERLEVPFLGEIPIDVQVCVGSDTGRPILIENAGSPIADVFRRVAGNLAGRVSVEALGEAAQGPVIRFG